MWSPVYLEMKKRINIKKEIVLKEKLDAKKKKLMRAKMFIDFPTSIYSVFTKNVYDAIIHRCFKEIQWSANLAA